MRAQLTPVEQFISLSRELKINREWISKKTGKSYVNEFIGTVNGAPQFKPREITTNATLRYDEWKSIDEAVIRVSRNRLTGINDLVSAGLVYNLNNGMATTQLLYEKASDALEAVLSIEPNNKSKGDLIDHSTHYLPLPITHSDFSIGERLLLESRVRGNGLDVAQAEAATRRVMEKGEDMLFGTTSPFNSQGNILYTYLTHPDVNEVSYDTTTVHWDTATPAQILANVLEMKQASIDANHYGPWNLYIPTNYDTVMDEDYRDGSSSSSTQTIRQRIEAINGINMVKVADRLPTDVVVMVQMTSDVVDLVVGMEIQTVESRVDFINNYKVMNIKVPRIKSDYNGNSGIVVLADSSYKA